MAESDTADKTEKASEQKLRKAREQGQVARSKDIGAAIGLLAGEADDDRAVYLEDFRAAVRLALAPLDGDDALQGLDALWGEAAHESLWLLAKMLMPLLALPAAVILATQTARHRVPRRRSGRRSSRG